MDFDFLLKLEWIWLSTEMKPIFFGYMVLILNCGTEIVIRSTEFVVVKLGIGRALFYSATRTCPQGTQLMSLPLFLVKQQMQHT